MFDPPSPLTYTQRYELTRSSKDPQRDKEKEGSEPQVNTLSNVIARLTEKVDSMDVKLTSLTNVVRLLQKYT